MNYVTLNNGVKMPMIGFGVFEIPKEETARCVYEALEVGYRLIDTAQAYYNEEETGDGIRQAIQKLGINREDIFLTTKVWVTEFGYEKTKASIEESLKKLKTDYIDLVLIHQCLSDYYGAYHALEDLYDEIKRQPEPEAQRIAAALELYVHGSLNVFNHRTNVDINNRIVCFDIKELGKQLKSLGMLVIQDQVWNRVSQNRDQGKSTWYFVDEFHLLLRGEVGTWSVEIWKRFRKWGGIPTGITQNIKDLLSSPEIENIFENSDFVYLLNQASGDRKILCERLNISNQQAAHISNAGPGEGLIFFGNVILPFVDDFPKDNELYSIMTTKLGETGKGENEHE